MKKKLLTLFLCLVMLVSIVSGCGKNEQSQGAPDNKASTSADSDSSAQEASLYTEVGSFPIINEKVTLKFFAPAIPSIEDLETNDFTKYMEEKTNIHIEWETAPMDSTQEKINLALSSGDYPDVFFGCDITPDMEEEYGTVEGIFISLNDLIDKYAVDFKAILAGRPEVRTVITATDGNIYGLPSIQDCYHCEYAQKMWVNQKWLSKLNIGIPTTTEEFYQMLKAFKEQDPNGNGQQDEIPLAGAKDKDGWHQSVDNFIMNAFIYDSGVYDPLRRYVKDGKADTSVDKPEYREGLRYLNKLFKEGLIYEASHTQGADQVKQIALNPGIEILGAAPAGHLAMFLDVVTDPERYRQYTSIPPLEGPNGVRQATHFEYDAVQPGEFVITKNNKYPEASIRYADAYYNYEIQMVRAWGEEGESWREAKEGELGMTGKQALYKTLIPFDEQAQNKHYSWLGIEYVPDELWIGMNVTPPDLDLYAPEGFEQLLYNETKSKYEPYKTEEYRVLPPLRFLPEESEQITTIQIELENYIKESTVRFIMGDLSLDTDWDSYVEGLESIGLSKYLEILQKAYDRIGNNN